MYVAVAGLLIPLYIFLSWPGQTFSYLLANKFVIQYSLTAAEAVQQPTDFPTCHFPVGAIHLLAAPYL